VSGSGILPRVAARYAEQAIGAVAREAARNVPLITFPEAEAIGCELHDWLAHHLGRDCLPMARDDQGWGNSVQFVLRRAHAASRDRAEKGTD
jgi:hypothetical protein